MDRSCDLFLEFWDPLHISGQVKIETSNLAGILIMRGTNDKNSKVGQRRGDGEGSSDLLLEL